MTSSGSAFSSVCSNCKNCKRDDIGQMTQITCCIGMSMYFPESTNMEPTTNPPSSVCVRENSWNSSFYVLQQITYLFIYIYSLVSGSNEGRRRMNKECWGSTICLHTRLDYSLMMGCVMCGAKSPHNYSPHFHVAHPLSSSLVVSPSMHR
jgi:hypothetical protein